MACKSRSIMTGVPCNLTRRDQTPVCTHHGDGCLHLHLSSTLCTHHLARFHQTLSCVGKPFAGGASRLVLWLLRSMPVAVAEEDSAV